MGKKLRPAGLAVLAALCYGISAPFSKLLLGQLSPTMLAALLYLGAGAGMLVILLARRVVCGFTCDTRAAAGLRRLRTEHLLLHIGSARAWRGEDKRLLRLCAVHRRGAVLRRVFRAAVALIHNCACGNDCGRVPRGFGESRAPAPPYSRNPRPQAQPHAGYASHARSLRRLKPRIL